MVRLQNGDSEVIEAWQRICDVSRRGKDMYYVCIIYIVFM